MQVPGLRPPNKGKPPRHTGAFESAANGERVSPTRAFPGHRGRKRLGISPWGGPEGPPQLSHFHFASGFSAPNDSHTC